MAYLLKSGLRVFSRFQTVSLKSNRLASLEGLISRRWVAAGTSEHTLAVRQQINDARKRGHEAGGAKRIEAQHRKVCCLVDVIIRPWGRIITFSFLLLSVTAVQS